MKRKLLLIAASLLFTMTFPVDATAAEQPADQTIEQPAEPAQEQEQPVEPAQEQEEPTESDQATDQASGFTLAATQYTVSDSITDVNGKIFKITRPNPNTVSKVNASQFGLSPDNYDNYSAFNSALAYCKSHPNTCLEINKGVYHFRTEESLTLNGFNNILIDGNGSEFVFSTPKYFKLNQCNSVEFRELAIEWDWESSRLASLVKISKFNKTAQTLEIEFMELDEVDLDIEIICFMQFDKVNLIPGSYGGYKTFYPNQVENGIVKREKVAPNKIKLYFGQEKYMNTFHDEEVYLIRHYTYGGRVFQPTQSENITFDDIHIYSAAGMGYIIGGNTKYFQIINSSIGRRTDKADAPYISTTADGIHILNSGGYFRIENCDFSYTGDDIVNIHDDVMSITRRGSDTVFYGKVTGDFVNVGDKVRFKNEQMGLYEGCEEFEAEVASFTRDPKTYDSTITFTAPVNNIIDKGGFIYRTTPTTSNYVIRNNYIHETKGRALLVLGSNALIENNTIYRTVSEGIHVLADIDSGGLGSQGCGASNVIIRGNTLTECTVSDKKPVVMVRYKNGDKISEYKDVLTNITLEDNKFIGCYTDALEVDNITNLTIKNNLVSDSGQIIVGGHCANVINTGNQVVTTTHVSTHDVIQIPGRAASCVSYGMKPIDYCNDCHRKLTDVIGIKPIPHNPGTAVVENRVEATGEKAGSYDEVTYCTECGLEVSRQTKEIPVVAGPVITKNLSNVTVNVGEKATFKVVATGEGLTYAWEKSATGGTKWASMAGTTGTRNINSVTAAMNGWQFRVKITDKYGKTVVSDVVTLTVKTDGPVITKNLSNVTVAAGGKATFTVTATGEGLTYAWEKSANGGAKWAAMAGATGTRTIKSVTAAMNGWKFRVIITDKDGRSVTSKEITMTVK